jgi:hypothetical protein
VKQAEKFGHDQRNTVANEVWGKLILAQMLNGRPTVVCCGAAHLVRAMESGSVAPPLPAYLHALQARIVVLAVANSENDQYIPAGTGTNDSLPCIEPIPEDGEEDEDD